MYKLLRSILFLFPPEWTHYFSMNSLKFLSSIGLKGLIRSLFKSKDIPVSLFGIAFKNPVGLGAGFDKNAKYLRELECLGFGFVEIGTVTPKPQPGNEKPRLFRLPKDKALINRMGFNNDGVEVIANRLKDWIHKNHDTINHKPQTPPKESGVLRTNYKLIIGGNIGKNKNTPNEDAWKDYETCLIGLHPYIDYFVVNVSSPNTPGLRELQEKRALYKILTHLQEVNKNYPVQKPLLLKIAPDLTQEQIEDVIDLALEIQLDGLVVCNTTISRDELLTASSPQGSASGQTTRSILRKNQKPVSPASRLHTIGAGGLSGKPLEKRSTELVSFISKKTNGKVPIIASGGIFTGEDAQEKLTAGASLVQVWTGFIYEGPSIVKKICKYLGH